MTVMHCADGRVLHRVRVAGRWRVVLADEPLTESEVLAALGITPATPPAAPAAIDLPSLADLTTVLQRAACRPPTVSVVIRAHREPHAWIDHAVQSALTQRGVSVEVILVLDDSRADTLVTDSRRLTIVGLAYGAGQAVARTVGVSLARGQFIRLLDADDELPAGSLAAQVKALRTAEADVCLGRIEPHPASDADCLVYDPWATAQPIEPLLGSRELAALLFDGDQPRVSGITALWRRSVAEDIAVPSDLRRCDDAAWLRLLLAAGATPVWLDRPVLSYRFRVGSRSRPDGQVGELRAAAGREALAAAEALAQHECTARVQQRPVRLGLVDWRMDVGGAQASLVQTLAHIDRRLVTPHVLLAEDSPGADWCRRSGLEVHVRPREQTGNLSGWLAGRCRDLKLDVLDFSWNAKLLTPQVRAAVPHTCFHLQSESLGHSGLADDAELVERFDHFIAVGQETAERNPLVRRVADRLTVIPSPVDGDACQRARTLRARTRAQLGLAEGQPLVVWSGRVGAPEKRYGTLLECVERLRRAVLDARVLVLGHLSPHCADGPRVRADLERAGREHGLIWLEHLRQWEVLPWVAAGDVYLSTAAIEGLSLALLEAMACGLVPVVTTACGMREAVSDPALGWVAETTDDLVHGLIAACRLPGAERAATGDLAAETAVVRYDVRRCARAHALAYRQLVEMGG